MDDTKKDDIGQRLSNVRLKLGHKKRPGFAELLGIPPDTLGSYERGVREPDLALLAVYAEQFGLNLNWLATGNGEMFADPSKFAKASEQLDETLMRTLAKIAIRAHLHAQIVLRHEDIAVEAATLYNELKEKADDINDAEEVKDLLPWLEGRLARRLAKLKADPANTTSKRA